MIKQASSTRDHKISPPSPSYSATTRRRSVPTHANTTEELIQHVRGSNPIFGKTNALNLVGSSDTIDLPSNISIKHIRTTSLKGGNRYNNNNNNNNNNTLCNYCGSSAPTSICFVNNDGRMVAAHLSRPYVHCPNCGGPSNRIGDNRPSWSLSRDPINSYRHHRLSNSRPQLINESMVKSKKKKKPLARMNFSASGTCHIEDMKDDNKICFAEDVKKSHFEEVDAVNRCKIEYVNSVDTCCIEDSNASQVLDGKEYVKAKGEDHMECLNVLLDFNIGMASHDDASDQAISSSAEVVEISPSKETSAGTKHGIEDVATCPSNINEYIANEERDSKCFVYLGDSEYSCSEDTTEISLTTTPKSMCLDDISSSTNFDEWVIRKESSWDEQSRAVWMKYKDLCTSQPQEAKFIQLRKQEIQARKQAEDWMLDCHIEGVLNKLAPDGMAPVKVLVRAFETVMHQLGDTDGSQTFPSPSMVTSMNESDSVISNRMQCNLSSGSSS